MSKQKQDKRMVVVTTDMDRRGVFFGELVSKDDSEVTLKDAQMCVYWSMETRGVLGLASHGPQKGSRVTPIIPSIWLDGVTSVMDCTEEAVEAWRAEPWE